MTTFAAALAALLLGTVALLGFSAAAARRIERAVPPQGGFLELDGERLHVLDKGLGPPVVMIHGLGGQMGNFTHSLVDRLAGEFRVVVFDRPGSGYSTRSLNAPAGVRAQAATLAKAMRALKLERPLIVGHSLGGAVALAIALDDPDCAGALALISPATHPVATLPKVFRGLGIGSPLLRRIVAWTLATPTGLMVRDWAARQVFAPETAPADFGAAGGGLLALRPRNIYASSADMMAAMTLPHEIESMTQRYASLAIPVGILFGRDDPILDYREHGEAMKEKLPSLRLELVDGGHMLPVTQPDLVAGFVRRMAAEAAMAAARSSVALKK